MESNVKAIAGVDVTDKKILQEITRLETVVDFYLIASQKPINPVTIRVALKKQIAVIKSLINE